MAGATVRRLRPGRATPPKAELFPYTLWPQRRPRPAVTAAVVIGGILIFGSGGIGIARFAAYGTEVVDLAPMPMPDAAVHYTEAQKAETMAGRKQAEKRREQQAENSQTAKPRTAKPSPAAPAGQQPDSTATDTDTEQQTPPATEEGGTQTPGPVTPTDTGRQTPPDDTAVEPQSGELVIRYGSDGFQPAAQTIAIGSTVTFINDSAADFWPVSGDSTGNGYDASFDAGMAIPPGSSWSYTPGAAGTWNFHDRLRPDATGSLTSH